MKNSRNVRADTFVPWARREALTSDMRKEPSSARLRCQTLLPFLLISLFCSGGHLLGDTAELTIKAQMGMQYDTLRFQVSPGQKVKVRLVNVDEIPHNIVFTASGKRLSVVKTVERMGADASASGYVPDLEPILAAIPVIDGGEEETLTFTAPEEPGVYPYVCTFPGHGYRMYGAMYVGDQELPSLAEDPHVPERQIETDRRNTQQGKGLNLPHAFTARRPFMYRIKMPDGTFSEKGRLKRSPEQARSFLVRFTQSREGGH